MAEFRPATPRASRRGTPIGAAFRAVAATRCARERAADGPLQPRVREHVSGSRRARSLPERGPCALYHPPRSAREHGRLVEGPALAGVAVRPAPCAELAARGLHERSVAPGLQCRIALRREHVGVARSIEGSLCEHASAAEEGLVPSATLFRDLLFSARHLRLEPVVPLVRGAGPRGRWCNLERDDLGPVLA